jgi:predicted nucleotidyltransferase
MQINSDYKDALQCFVEGQVQFLVIGGYAVIKHSEPYNTKDIDLWIAPNRANAERAFEALRRFGAPVAGLSVEDLMKPDMIYQVGVEPVRIDVMCFVPGLDFDSAWERRDTMNYAGIAVPVLSIEDTLAAKKASKRPKDRIQAIELERIVKRRPRTQ